MSPIEYQSLHDAFTKLKTAQACLKTGHEGGLAVRVGALIRELEIKLERINRGY